MIRNRFYLAVFLLMLFSGIKAQTDNLFWFGAPDVSNVHGDSPWNGAPIYLHITAVTATTVTVSQPANAGFTPITFSLDELEHYTIRLDDIMGIDKIETYPQALPLTPANRQKKAFKIESNPGNITVYYELDQYWNRDIFSLKGRNALGRDFFVSTQNLFDNGTYSGTAFSGFVIAATENNTTIKVYPNDDYLYFDTNPGDVITINLNAGETFAFRSENRFANRHINGVKVTSDKDIAITWYDDSVRKKNNNTTACSDNISYDICGDQTIPIDLIGNKYLVMKGQIVNSTSCDGGERIFITATQNNTLVYINGTLVTTLANAGDVFNYQLNSDVLLVETSQPVYVNHLTGFGGEMGGAVLPNIEDCTGSYDVTITRTPNTGDAFFLNIMGRNDTASSSPSKNKTIHNFTITANGVTSVIPSNYFDYVLDSTWVVLKKTPEVIAYIAGKINPGDEARISNPYARFHLGVINGGTSTGCKYGYFSDYAADYTNAGIGGPNAPQLQTFCDMDPIHLVASGGKSYKWYGHLNPNDTAHLSSTIVADPYFFPVKSGFYVFRVDVDRECFSDTSLYVGVYVIEGPKALFEVNTVVGCSPLNITFTNLSDTAKAAENYWNFDTRFNTTVNQSSLTNPFPFPYPPNYTDTIQKYTVRLTVKGDYHMCPDQSEQTISVLPSINAGFTADTNMGCSPLLVHFNDTSVGYIDTLNSYWDFGTYQERYKPATSFTFYNNHTVDSVIMVRLVAYSTHGCVDTAVFPITVHPSINASFSANNLTRCSPLVTTFNPFGSTGVKDYYWRIYDQHGTIIDSSFVRTDKNPFGFTHYDYSQPNPDTLYVGMYGVSQYGCVDSATTKKLITFPEVIASFNKSNDIICDSVSITFNNNSIGYNLMSEWDLGDGTFLTDTSEASFSHVFYNRTGATQAYPIKLVTTSDYFCTDSIIDTVRVHPFVNANFAIDYGNNCSPLTALLTNTSFGGDVFNWTLGDGSTFTNFTTGPFNHIYHNNTDHDTTYFIKLIASNTEGCIDSVKRSVSLYAQVAANFNFTSPNEGCNPLNVSFQNSSKGTDLNYQWNFGDNTFSTSQNPPPKIYQNATAKDTTYYVSLTVMNLAGCDSSITKTVGVYSKVTADFSIARVDSCSPFKIDIDNFSSGGITDFTWKYTEADSMTLHDFSDPDIPVYRNQTLLPIRHPIVLRTQNSHGCAAMKADTITVFPEMHADFHPDKVAGCQPLTVILTNNSNIKSGTSFFWDFGNGKFSNLANPPAHVFSNLTSLSRINNVKLSATTQYGCVDDTIIKVEVYPYIYAKFNIDRPEICSDELFTIDRSSSAGAINHYYWDYTNDGVNDEDKATAEFTHTYSNTGTTDLNPTIKLTVTNEKGCDTTWTETIAVHPQVRAAFNVDNNEVCYPKAISFLNNSSPAVPMTYNWNFGDGSGSVSKNPTHAYTHLSRTTDRSFTVNLTATSEYGCDSTISKTVTIHPKPLADFNFPVAVDCPPFAVQFTDNSMGTNLSYNWDFDNGHTSTLKDPAETFNNKGSVTLQHDIVLVVTTAFNCSDTAAKPIQVYPDVEVSFDASDWDGCNPMQINLDGTATNENEYYWSVNGSVISNYQDLSYRFVNETTADKVFDVNFKAVSVNGCYDDTTRQITIYPRPLAEFLPSPQAQDFNTETDITPVTFNNNTLNQPAWAYQWSFGDGSTSTEMAASFVKNYTIWGDINNDNRIPVSLIATNANHPACADTVAHFVVIKPPLPRVDLGPDVAGCVPFTVDFPSTTKYNYPDSYQWDLGYNGQSSTDKEPQPLSYNKDGTYIIRLAVEGDGGTSWDYKTITVYPRPNALYNFMPDSVWVRSETEMGTPIRFYNQTTLANTGGSDVSLTYKWDFSDGNESTEENPAHEYMETGRYFITLYATSGVGCMDTFVHEKPAIIFGGGLLQFPNVINVFSGNPVDEYYDNPRNANNSLFRPADPKGVEKYRLEIYNRWGELVFESDDVYKGWNGFIDGEPAKQDVYVWRVTATFTNGKPYVSAGDLTVLVRPR